MQQLTIKGNTALTFGQALELVKEGKLVQRMGWNGKGMFIFQRPSDTIQTGNIAGDSFTIQQVKSLPQAVKDYYKKTATETIAVAFTPYLCMKAADNTIVNGWLASQTDMLSNDWAEVGYND